MNTDPALLASAGASLSRSPVPDVAAPSPNGHERPTVELPGAGPIWAVFAPGRLDVMGGVAESSGALVLNLPLKLGASVAARRRDDGHVFIQTQVEGSTDARRSLSMPVARLLDEAGRPKAIGELSAILRECADPAWGLALGAWTEACRAGLFQEARGGVALSIMGLPSITADVGLCAALLAATLGACARVYGAELEPVGAARVCRDVEQALTGLACEVGDALCALTGEGATLAHVRCRPCQIGSSVQVPEGVALVGFDCGFRDPRRQDAYLHARTASQMGRVLIERILAHEGASDIRKEGLLSRLTMNDFVDRFRDRLPMKLSGRDFLDRFGETGDPHTRINPAETYKVRSRTEHQIYENCRSVQFAERLVRYARTKDPMALHEAGELMHASHWSHGQRCGMGSVATDRLVTLLRKRGHSCGVFGAKTSGRGCGGLVVALVSNSSCTSDAIAGVLDEYEAQAGRRPLPLSGSAHGALKSEAARL